MTFIVRNYSLNKLYYIDKNVFNDILQYIIKKDIYKNIKIVSSETIIENFPLLLILKINIQPKKDANILKIFKILIKDIKNKVLELFQLIPNNILINLLKEK